MATPAKRRNTPKRRNSPGSGAKNPPRSPGATKTAKSSTAQRQPPPGTEREFRGLSPEFIILVLLVATLVGFVFRGSLDVAVLRSWATVFVSTFVQALPFLALGVSISALIAVYVPSDAIERFIPDNPLLAVPSAGLAGMALPGCECGAVPIAGRLMSSGARPAVALTFLLAAPAVNPVVLISTAVAFPGQPEIVLARYVASMLTAVAMGWLWIRHRREDLVRLSPVRHSTTGKRSDVARNVMAHDLFHAGGYLVAGAMVAAGFQVLVPDHIIESVSSNWWLSILLMAALAVVLSICSEADAFVAAGLPGFSNTSRLVFMVVGPTVDVKLVAMQSGVFGRRFAFRFAPTTLVVAVLMSVIVGSVLL